MPEYNGWTNYETWAVNLWLDNDEGSQEMTREWTLQAIQEVKARSPHPFEITPERQTVHLLVEILKSWIEENNPFYDNPSLYSDLLSAAISEVNWYEIAEHWVDELWTDDPEEDEEEEEDL